MFSDEEWEVLAAARTKIPAEWSVGQANTKKAGWRWQDPSNQGNGVRIDRGNANSRHPSQQIDHVVVRREGQIMGRVGKPIEGSIRSNPTAAHIPLVEWLPWRTWYEP